MFSAILSICNHEGIGITNFQGEINLIDKYSILRQFFGVKNDTNCVGFDSINSNLNKVYTQK